MKELTTVLGRKVFGHLIQSLAGVRAQRMIMPVTKNRKRLHMKHHMKLLHMDGWMHKIRNRLITLLLYNQVKNTVFSGIHYLKITYLKKVIVWALSLLVVIATG